MIIPMSLPQLCSVFLRFEYKAGFKNELTFWNAHACLQECLFHFKTVWVCLEVTNPSTEAIAFSQPLTAREVYLVTPTEDF